MGFNNRQYQRTFLTGTASGSNLAGGTAQIFSGAGTFHGVVVGTTTGTQMVVADAINQTGIVMQNSSTVMILKASIAEGNYIDIDASIANGLYVAYGASGTYTILWSKD